MFFSASAAAAAAAAALAQQWLDNNAKKTQAEMEQVQKDNAARAAAEAVKSQLESEKNPPIVVVVGIGLLLTAAGVITELGLTAAEVALSPTVISAPVIGVPLEAILIGCSLFVGDLEMSYWSYAYRVLTDPDVKQSIKLLPPWGW